MEQYITSFVLLSIKIKIHKLQSTKNFFLIYCITKRLSLRSYAEPSNFDNVMK